MYHLYPLNEHTCEHKGYILTQLLDWNDCSVL